MIPTTDRLRLFADTITTYLHINQQYRATGPRNPLRRQELKKLRNVAFKTAQTHNADLHTHLLQYTEPDYTALQARELIRLWDARNTCYQNLIHLSPDDNPRDAIQRLDNAEKKLRAQLQKVEQTLKTLSTN